MDLLDRFPFFGLYGIIIHFHSLFADVDQRRKQDRDDLMSRPIFEPTGSGLVRRKSHSLEKQVLHSKLRKAQTQTASSSLRQAVKRGPKRCYGFDDLEVASTSKKAKLTEKSSKDGEEIAEEEIVKPSDDNDELVRLVAKNADNECKSLDLSQIDKSAQKALPVATSISSAAAPEPSGPKKTGSPGCSKQSPALLIAYSDSDQEDSD